MKILELEIHNVRGIRDITLTPNGKNLVVWGPNGSGKSAVVDALDFLLTGKITRLMGKGTGGISLNKHGPHVDCKPEEAIVSAKIQLANVKEPIEIKRCIGNPNEIECDEAVLPYLEPIMTLAKHGQHVLTRREILRYVTAEGATRAEEIQELLSISEIEEIRKSLVRVQNDSSKELQAAQKNLDKAKGTVSATIQQPAFSTEALLDVVNHSRAVFGAESLTAPTSSNLKSGIKLPTAVVSEYSVNTTLFENDVNNLRFFLTDKSQSGIAQYDGKLREVLTAIKSNPSLQKSMAQQELVSLGKKLIVDDDTACPLCDTPWEVGKLSKHLDEKLASAEIATKYQSEIQQIKVKVSEKINFLLASLQKVIATSQTVGLHSEVALLNKWQSDLSVFSNALSKATESYLNLKVTPEEIRRLFAPTNLQEISEAILSAVRLKFPEATPEQTAWDMLTKLEENMKVLESAESEFNATTALNRKASLLIEKFQETRDKTLQNLYNEIRATFESLYKEIHGTDENNFEASIEPDGASLNFEVSFYGRGKHPPHALHSEGHQDSMGLCLYLALAEKLTKGLIELVILDDVVMSVDADHRRELCKLLTKNFPHRQFLITTHDKTWATQLKTEGVVNSKGSIEFFNWSVDTGPQINIETSMWEKIEKDLQNNDVPSAAAKLRRGSEQFFSETCDVLQAQIRYRANGRWELGDFMPATISRYKSLLKNAKVVAQSWSNQDDVRTLNEIESIFSQIVARTQSESWAVNASVHYNNWANLGEKDFRPVLEAFQDLHSALTCNACQSILYVSTTGLELESLRCACGKVNWNLKENPKKTKT
jgi:recombinational DNA repair ATPase RecF